MQLVDELGHRASSLYDGHGRTALHYAAHRRHLPMMDLLLRLHFDPRSCDVFGLCPLHYVALDSDEDAFTLLHRALRAAYGLPCPGACALPPTATGARSAFVGVVAGPR